MASASALSLPSTTVSVQAICSDSRWGMAHFVCDSGAVAPQLLQEQSRQSSIIFQVRVSDMHSIPEGQAVCFSYSRSSPTASSPTLYLVVIVPAVKLYALVCGKIRYHTTIERTILSCPYQLLSDAIPFASHPIFR